MEYTKGEWKLRDYDIILKGSGSRIAKMDIGWPNQDILANAHLIAAAPDMYEALKAVKWVILNRGKVDINWNQVLADIDQALAKADSK